MVQIKDLKNGMKGINIVVEVDFIGEGNKYASYGEEVWVPGFVKDETGEIKATFWGEFRKKVKEGMKLKFKKAYITSYNGQLQLNTREEIEILKKK